MANDKRTVKQAPPGDIREGLNAQQRMTLGELEMLGWTLKFVRRPLFQDPVPVVVSNDNDEIGLLDPEGKIIIDKTGSFRDDGDEPEGSPEELVELEAEAEAEAAAEADWIEKRRGETAVPDNLEDYLNNQQLTALRQIENFGWELKFVRRPLFQEPIAVIMNADGDRLGTLEFDGRIDLKSEFDLRDGTVEPDTEEATRTAEEKKQVI
jgi:hypothetical protein